MSTTTVPRHRFRLHRSLWMGAVVLFAFPALGTLMGRADWGAEDFAAMAFLLVVLCGAVEAALHWLDAPRWRIGGIMLAVLLFLTALAHLAVDIFG
jgi:hypothetical protein